MNRFVAVGLVAEAERGRHVVVLSDGPGRLAMALVLDMAGSAEVDRVERVRGREAIVFASGGRLSFVSGHWGEQRLAGLTADTLYLDGAYKATDALSSALRHVAPEVVRP